MRTIYYTKEQVAIVQNRRTRRNLAWMSIMVLAMLIGMEVLFPPPGLEEAPHFLITCPLLGIIFFYALWHRRRLVKNAGREPLPVQLTLNDEKVAVEENTVKVTILLNEITKILEIEGCIVLLKQEGISIMLPKDQLLEDELKLLDGVQNRLQAPGEFCPPK